MDNYKLLDRYRKKLSIYFALFVIFSIWGIVFVFDLSDYMRNDISEKKILQNKALGVKNIIKNKDIYSEIEELTFKKVVSKVLSDTTISYSGDIIFEDIPDFNLYQEIPDETYVSILGYKYYKTKYIVGTKVYDIFVRKEIKLSIKEMVMRYLYFVLFSLPFYFLYYFIGYFLVGKSLKPIKESMNSMEEFVGNINHEFNTPLSEIISSLELSVKTKNYEKNVDRSIQSARKLSNIVHALSGFVASSNLSFKKQYIDLVTYSQDIIKEYKNFIDDKKIKLIFHCEKKVILKKINAEHFYICFSNILSNAIKYSKNKGKIQVEINTHGFIVKDNGIGIDKKYLDKIFDRYFRESYISDGKGLGLSLVKKICDSNEWSINIKSEKGKKTEVSIKF